jgi:hypothetical protein
MKRLLAVVFLLPFFLMTPVFGQDAKQPSKEDVILKKLEELQKSIDGINSIRKDVEKSKTDISDLQTEVKKLKADLAATKAVTVPKYDDSDIRREIDDLRREIEALRLKLNTQYPLKEKTTLKPPRVEVTREPYYPSKRYDDDDYYDRVKTTKVSYYNPPEVQYGKVRFVNTYHQSYTVTVNGERYTAKAGDTLVVDYVMPGEFTYQVIGVTDLRRRTLAAKETFTVTIHPQPQPQSYGGSSYYSGGGSYYPSYQSYCQPVYYTPPACYTPPVVYAGCR